MLTSIRRASVKLNSSSIDKTTSGCIDCQIDGLRTARLDHCASVSCTYRGEFQILTRLSCADAREQQGWYTCSQKSPASGTRTAAATLSHQPDMAGPLPACMLVALRLHKSLPLPVLAATAARSCNSTSGVAHELVGLFCCPETSVRLVRRSPHCEGGFAVSKLPGPSLTSRELPCAACRHRNFGW